MKKIMVALAVASTMIMAGGDIAPVEAKVVEVVPSKNFYLGISTQVGVGSEVENIDWFGFTTVGAQAGYTFYRYGNFDTAVEARYSTDTQNFGGDYTYGAYVKPGYDMGGITAYGLVGYQDSNGIEDFFDGELGYGGGLQTDIFGLDVFADYLYGNDTKSEIVTVGVNYRF